MSSNLSPVYLTGVAQGSGPLARAMHGCAHLLPARGSKVEYSYRYEEIGKKTNGMQASAMVLATVYCTKNKQHKNIWIHLDTNQVLSRVLD